MISFISFLEQDFYARMLFMSHKSTLLTFLIVTVQCSIDCFTSLYDFLYIFCSLFHIYKIDVTTFYEV